MRLIRAATYRIVAWQNGGGTTADIDVVDVAGRVQWRTSIATIQRSGPFSDFDVYDSTIAGFSAVAVAQMLTNRADSVDVGLALNSINFAGFRVDVAAMLEPFQKLTVAARIIVTNMFGRSSTHRDSISLHPNEVRNSSICEAIDCQRGRASRTESDLTSVAAH